VSVYFASDMHLRLDRPDRGQRLARWVDTLGPEDPLYLVGDVCDFWYAARQRVLDPPPCDGLRALARYTARGGTLTVLPGNHDNWLGPFYERALGARFVPGPLTVEAHGLRLYLVHGHRVGGRQVWKAGMESHAFLTAFGRLPGPVAGGLDRLLDRSNGLTRAREEARMLAIFRRHLAEAAPEADVAVFGHVHTPLDDPASDPRLVILGGWHHGSSFLRVDESGAALVIEPAARHVSV
jgi:UDP-2,3-diacylglucosamine hydrolase